MRQPAVERIFELSDGRQVPVRIFPAEEMEPAMWGCDWEIEWPDRVKRFFSAGIDGVQAMQLAMSMIEATLLSSEEARAGKLTWLGGYDLSLTNHASASGSPPSGSGRSVDLASGRLAFRVFQDSSTPVLLLHGNSSSSDAFGRLIPLLAEAGLPIIAPDFPGHGASDNAREPERTYSFPGYAAAISGLLDALGIDRAIAIGWSLGGHVAMELLTIEPRVAAALVTGAPPIRPSLNALQSAFLATPVMGLAGKESFSVDDARAYAAAMLDGEKNVKPHAVEMALRTDGRARRLMIENGVAGQGADETALLRSGPARLAIVQGDEDVFLSMDYLKTLPDEHLWRGAIQWLGGLGHAPHWTAPERFASLALAFVKEMRAA